MIGEWKLRILDTEVSLSISEVSDIYKVNVYLHNTYYCNFNKDRPRQCDENVMMTLIGVLKEHEIIDKNIMKIIRSTKDMYITNNGLLAIETDHGAFYAKQKKEQKRTGDKLENDNTKKQRQQ